MLLNESTGGEQDDAPSVTSDSNGETPAIDSGESASTFESKETTTEDELSESSPSVTTDKDDYAPGETATIATTGFDVGASVTFEVDHVSDAGSDGAFGTFDDTIVQLVGEGHDAWTVTDGGTGVQRWVIRNLIILNDQAARAKIAEVMARRK